MSIKILAVAAHPGDALFTMGALVAKSVQEGGSGTFLSLTLGEKGHVNYAPQEYGALQRTAMEEAAALLGAENILLSYPDAEIAVDEEIVLRVCDIIRQVKPAVVVTHWSGSWHKDHRAAHRIVNDALFYADLATLQRSLPSHRVAKLYYAENWEDASDFSPEVMVDVSAVFDRWTHACALFPMWKGETGLIRYNDYYKSLAVMRGCLSNCQFAISLMSDPNARTRRLRNAEDLLD